MKEIPSVSYDLPINGSFLAGAEVKSDFLNFAKMQIPTPFESVPSYLDGLAKLIREFSFLHLHHAVDFYNDDYFNSSVFPPEWRALKQTVSLNDLLQLASYGTTKQEWPESLHRFVHLARTTPINRAQCALATNLPLKQFPKDMKNGLSPKKQHEVQYLAALINSIASRRGIERIMDIGAGQGYLDLSLAFQYGKTVIGVDDDQIQTCGAKRRSDLLETKSFVKRGDVPVGKLFHVNRRVHANETFASLVEQIGKAAGDEDGKIASTEGGKQDLFGNRANEAAGSENWLLCGLHACGDLTPAVMKHFLQSEASALVVVGCCYNMLTENKPENPSLHSAVGFPLSAYMLSRSPIFHLGFAARTLACQATCRWADDVNGADNFRRHHFRALLQYVLCRHGLTDRARANSKASIDQDIIIGRLKPSAFTQGFPFYAKLALSRLKMDAGVEGLTDCVLQAYEDAFREREIEIAIVWTLRSMMGEVFESMLLADRYLYLSEQLGVDGGTVELLPLFEPVLSPRNMALVAVKTG